MRRNLIHLLIAMITFAAGIAPAALWNSVNTPAPAPAAPTILSSGPATEPAKIENGGPAVAVKRKVEFYCVVSPFSFLLDDLRKHNPDVDVDGLIEALGKESCTELFEIEQIVDLNGDGRNEFVIRTKNSEKGNFFCGSTGNCQTWVVREEKKRYKIILDAGSVEKVEIQREMAGNYHNLTARYHGGAMLHTIASYGYRNGKYQLRKCAEETVTTNGTPLLSRADLAGCR